MFSRSLSLNHSFMFLSLKYFRFHLCNSIEIQSLSFCFRIKRITLSFFMCFYLTKFFSCLSSKKKDKLFSLMFQNPSKKVQPRLNRSAKKHNIKKQRKRHASKQCYHQTMSHTVNTSTFYKVILNKSKRCIHTLKTSEDTKPGKCYQWYPPVRTNSTLLILFISNLPDTRLFCSAWQ